MSKESPPLLTTKCLNCGKEFTDSWHWFAKGFGRARLKVTGGDARYQKITCPACGGDLDEAPLRAAIDAALAAKLGWH